MRILIALPTVSACGGVRVLFEYAVNWAAVGHDVVIGCDEGQRQNWFGLGNVPIKRYWECATDKWDLVIASSPNTVDFASRVRAARRIYFVQMMEHLFESLLNPSYYANRATYGQAHRAGFGFITIARWLQDELSKWGIQAPVIPNGINPEHFHQERVNKRDYILVEGDDRNQAKDIYGLGWRAALSVAPAFGLRVVAMTGVDNPLVSRCDMQVKRPDVDTMRRLYGEAVCMVKASRFEGRSLAPLEAMACGTATVRAIVAGDDDVIDGVNSVRTEYALEPLAYALRDLLQDPKRLNALERGGIETVSRLQWPEISAQFLEYAK